MLAARIAATASLSAAALGAAALDDDSLRAALTPALQRFAVVGDASFTIDDAAERSVARWTEVEVDAAVARTATAEATASVAGADIAGLGDGAEPRRVQRVVTELDVRRLVGGGVIGADVGVRTSRANTGRGWRGDTLAGGFATVPMTEHQTLVAWCSYDTGRTWIPIRFLPGIADLIADDDTWWALLGLPLDVRWQPCRWCALSAGFIDDPFADATCALSAEWSWSIDAAWRQEAARTARGLDVVEELRITSGPTFHLDDALELDFSAGVAVGRRSVTNARLGGLGGSRSPLPTAGVVSLECTVAY